MAEVDVTLQELIRNYVLESVNIAEIENDCDLFESGIVNSLFAIELMTFLEKTFEIKVTMDDLDMDNFKTINASSEFVRRKKEEAGA
jgi:acyl carrier protein